jgi:hypothetical protein
MAEENDAWSRHDIEAKLVKKCWEDEEFRKEFTADPVGTAVKHLEVPAASLPQIVVHEEPAGSWHIVLPPKPADSGELSEEDLEKVAGGLTPVFIVSISVSASAVVSGGVTISGAVTVKKGW